jgi:hypothetical protein
VTRPLVQYVQPDPDLPLPRYLNPWWPNEVCLDDAILERWRVSGSSSRTAFFDIAGICGVESGADL